MFYLLFVCSELRFKSLIACHICSHQTIYSSHGGGHWIILNKWFEMLIFSRTFLIRANDSIMANFLFVPMKWVHRNLLGLLQCSLTKINWKRRLKSDNLFWFWLDEISAVAMTMRLCFVLFCSVKLLFFSILHQIYSQTCSHTRYEKIVANAKHITRVRCAAPHQSNGFQSIVLDRTREWEKSSTCFDCICVIFKRYAKNALFTTLLIHLAHICERY